MLTMLLCSLAPNVCGTWGYLYFYSVLSTTRPTHLVEWIPRTLYHYHMGQALA